jgi:hypothetical protein
MALKNWGEVWGEVWGAIWEPGDPPATQDPLANWGPIWVGIWGDIWQPISYAPVNPTVFIRPLVQCTPVIAPALSVTPRISQ